MNKILDSFNTLPRAVRWLLIFAAFLAAYYLVLEPALDATNTARDRADRLEAALRRERALLAANSLAGRELDRGTKTFGVPRHPTDPTARPETLQRSVNTILLKHGVENAVYSERSGTIRQDEAVAVVGAAAKLDRYVLDVIFETTPAVAMAILADLEQASEVTAVSRIKIDKSLAGRGRSADTGSGRAVRITIAVESWIAAPAATSSTASSGWEGRR